MKPSLRKLHAKPSLFFISKGEVWNNNGVHPCFYSKPCNKMNSYSGAFKPSYMYEWDEGVEE